MTDAAPSPRNETTAPPGESAKNIGLPAPVPAGDLSAETRTEPPAPEDSSLPQMDVTTFPSQLFWLVITFAAMYWVTSRRILPRISEVLEKRRTKISHDLDQAESLQQEADKTRREYEKSLQEARQKASVYIAEAHDAINRQSQERNEKLNETLARQMREAETRITLTRNKAMQRLSPVAADISRDIVGKLLGKSPDLGSVNQLVDKAFKERA